MIVQACLNGARSIDYHSALPVTPAELANAAAASVEAGVAELHLHPRASDGRESLDPKAIDPAVLAIRNACPGTPIGVSTGDWIEGNEARTRNLIGGWSELPDYASVNLSEPDAPAVMNLLRKRGIGIEAGLASVADAERLVALDHGRLILRVLIEISEQDFDEASLLAAAIQEVLNSAQLRKPVLLHGFDVTVWPFVRLAAEKRLSTRVGLEDGNALPDGTIAAGNAELVSAAVEIFRARTLK